jgi:hypothetical protein
MIGALLIGFASTPANASSKKSEAKAYAKSYMKTTYGWGASQFACLDKVFNYESHWNDKDKNSRYLGIPQVNVGFVHSQGYSKKQFMSSHKIQVRVGLTYVKKRYGTPCKAWSHIKKRGWY